jgi:hypothetical protein
MTGGGTALAGVQPAPLTGSASATLYQVNAGEWQVTVYLDTAALCAGKNPAGNKFSLVTGKPGAVTGAAAPAYPDGPLACGATGAHPVTEVKLSFTPAPALSAVPQSATLVVTPPPALLSAADPPAQIPLTVRRIVSPWQYAGIPAICGAALAVLLVLVLIAIGAPGKRAGQATAPAQHKSAPPGPPGETPGRGQVDFGTLLLLQLVVAKRRDFLVTELPVVGGLGGAAGRPAASRTRAGGTGAAEAQVAEAQAADGAPPAGGSSPKVKRVHLGREFWGTPLFAGAAWSFGDSWATSVTPLTALAGGVLTASGAVAGLVPGVDLTRFGLLMALVGGLTVIAPLLFGAVNALFPAKDAVDAAPAGEVVATRLWVMLLASCLTVFAIGVEIGFVGLVLGFELIVVSPSVRWIGPVVTGLAALLFLAYGAHSILTLVGQPDGTAKKTAKKHSFLL